MWRVINSLLHIVAILIPDFNRLVVLKYVEYVSLNVIYDKSTNYKFRYMLRQLWDVTIFWIII
jgi:hypothetical protein